MNTHNTHSIFPVMLKVPDENEVLSKRASVAFLRQFARRAVLLSAEKSGMGLKDLHNDASGAPLPASGIFWSLSHKPGYVAGVVSTLPIGIDVEPIRSVSKALVDKILDLREQELGAGNSPEFFCRCWTAKEAVLKAVGMGLKGLSRCRILKLSHPTALTVCYDQRQFHIEQAVHDDHIVSVVSHGRAVRWGLPARNQDIC